MTLPVIVLVGATATGKSGLAIDLAVELGRGGLPTEVVNADSMLVYRGMDIGTAKPTLAERRGIPHHMIDIMEIDQAASVAQFQVLARAAIERCRERGVMPIVVGGSALYLHAIIDQFDFPPSDPQVRADLEAAADQQGTAVLYERLMAKDPAVAAAIQPGNTRRIIRALESIQLTGGFHSTLPTWRYAVPGVIQIGIQIERDAMDRRIAERVERMWQAGFVDEVRGLAERGLASTPTASRAIGYRQILQGLDHDITMEQAKQATIIKTRQFSRKQLSWWRRDERVTWFPVGVDAQQLIPMVTRDNG
ncbi:MAG: tRNA (adenosine(37)-N6)-dimethylallyltransferase MiaA [Propionibacteriaceae bacterium]|jgi:tRNA dimethylallyltransferase|nr:tRNA (adenosine(37)-N6)-dimethylallyltransferase MiaA [Propionibacteriaceae bacterium]